jgi:hypothetical protein
LSEIKAKITFYDVWYIFCFSFLTSDELLLKSWLANIQIQRFGVKKDDAEEAAFDQRDSPE